MAEKELPFRSRLVAGTVHPLLDAALVPLLEELRSALVRIGTIEAAIEGGGRHRAAADARLGEAEAALSELGKQLGERFATLGEKLASFEQRLTSVDGQIASVDSKIASLDGQLASLDAKLASFDAKLASFDGKLASLDGKLAPLHSGLASVESRLDVAAEGIETLRESVSALESRREAADRAHAAEIAGISRRVDEAAGALASVRQEASLTARTAARTEERIGRLEDAGTGPRLARFASELAELRARLGDGAAAEGSPFSTAVEKHLAGLQDGYDRLVAIAVSFETRVAEIAGRTGALEESISGIERAESAIAAELALRKLGEGS